MAFTTEELVREIIEIDPAVVTLAPFILAASLVVEAHCTDISEEDQVVVETWLAAHFVTIRDTRTAQETVKSVTETVQFKVDLGLNSSMYGQTAMRVDPTGGLARWESQVKAGRSHPIASVTWIGSELE